MSKDDQQANPRRRFLAGGLKASAALALGPVAAKLLVRQARASAGVAGESDFPPFKQADNPPGLGDSPDNPADCLVLGAGISGVTAARDIFHATGASVIVLEASDRIGGRMHTLRNIFGTGLCAEEGGEFIHVQPHPLFAHEDPIWSEVRRYGLSAATIPHVMNGMIYFNDWRGRKLRSVIETGIQCPGVWFQFSDIDGHRGEDLSAREFIDRRRLHGHALAMSELEICGHVPGLLEEISINGFKSDRYSALLSEMADHHVVEGYDTLPRKIAEGLDVRMGQMIERVRWGQDGVEVQTTDGKTYHGRTAVCTFSVGMLKSGKVSFDPPLPASKQNALKSIELGEVAKIIIPFTQRFWPGKMAMLNTPGADRLAQKTYFVLGYGEREQAPMLTAYMTGVDAKKFRLMGDLDALKLVCADLDRMYPEAAPTFDLILRLNGEPQFHRKQWIDDPLACGGYSFLTVAKNDSVAVTEVRTVLSQAAETAPLFWAGEALATKFPTTPGTVHSAHVSGMETARKVLSYLDC